MRLNEVTLISWGSQNKYILQYYPSLVVFQIYWKGGKDSLPASGYSTASIRSSDLLKHWRATHPLDGCSTTFVTWSDNSDSVKHWRGTHSLDACSSILVSGSDPVEHWRGTHSLDACSPFLSVVLILRNTGEAPTNWMHIQFTHSHQWFWSCQSKERDSQPGCMFTDSH